MKMKQLTNNAEEQINEYERAAIRVYRLLQIKRLMSAVSKQNATPEQRKVIDPMIEQLKTLLLEAEKDRDIIESKLKVEGFS